MTATPQWEYLVLLAEGPGPETGSTVWTGNGEPISVPSAQRIWDYLNHLGGEGWELVSSPARDQHVLKRPKVADSSKGAAGFGGRE